MANNTPRGMKKHREGQNCVTLSWWFLHKQQRFTLHEQYTSPLLFYNFEVSQSTSNQSLKSCGFICDTIFFTCTLHTNHLATKCAQDCAELKVWLVCMETCRERLCHPLLTRAVFEQSLVNDAFSQYCIHLLRKPVRGDLLFCDRWQTSAQTCTCCNSLNSTYI